MTLPSAPSAAGLLCRLMTSASRCSCAGDQSLHLCLLCFGRNFCQAMRHDPAQCPICSWAAVPPYDMCDLHARCLQQCELLQGRMCLVDPLHLCARLRVQPVSLSALNLDSTLSGQTFRSCSMPLLLSAVAPHHCHTMMLTSETELQCLKRVCNVQDGQLTAEGRASEATKSQARRGLKQLASAPFASMTAQALWNWSCCARAGAMNVGIKNLPDCFILVRLDC